MTDMHVAEANSQASMNLRSLLPAVVLLAAGFTVTFTQHLHAVLSFNAWLVGVFGVVYGLMLLLSMLQTLGGSMSPETMTIASVSIGLGIVAPLMPSTAALSLLLLVWVSIIVVLQMLSWARSRDRDALAVALFAALFAVILAFAARELPAVMGFFAAYCILVGVYLGIASFDRTPAEVSPEVSQSTEDGS